MNTRNFNRTVFGMAIVFTALIVLIAVLEVATALRFQFPEMEAFDLLPANATAWAIRIGPVFWVLMNWVVWEDVDERSSYRAVIEAMALMFFTAASIVAAVIGPFAFFLWANVAIWSLVAFVFATSLLGDWRKDSFNIRTAVA